MKLTLSLAAAWLVMAPLQGQSGHADIVRRALAGMDSVNRDAWAFTETRSENGSVTVSRFDPSLPDSSRWTLTTVDGIPATDEEVLEAGQQRNRPRETSDDNSMSIRIGGGSGMIDPDNLTFIEETDLYLRFSFDPVTTGENSELYSHLEGTLMIAKVGPYVASLKMWNPQPFSPDFRFKITRYMMGMTYMPVGKGGPFMLASVVMEIKGKAMIFIGIEEAIEMTFSDYERVRR